MTNPTSDRHREAAREILVAIGGNEMLMRIDSEKVAAILAKHFPSPSSDPDWHSKGIIANYEALISKIQKTVGEYFGPDERESDFDVLDQGVAKIAADAKASPSSGTGGLVEALRGFVFSWEEFHKHLPPCEYTGLGAVRLAFTEAREALRNAEAGRQGDGIFWRGGDRYLREHGKEYRLMDLAPNQETRWIKEHAEAGRQPQGACMNEFTLKHGYSCELPRGHTGDHEATCPNPQFTQRWPADSKPAGERTGATKCGCRVSTGICGCLTFGTGLLDANGFFNNPCPHGSEVHGCNAPSAIGEKGNEDDSRLNQR